MINLHERMLPTSAGVEPATSWSPVGRRIQLSHRGRLLNQQKGKNDHRNYFMVKVYKRMLPTLQGLNLQPPDRQWLGIQLSHLGRPVKVLYSNKKCIDFIEKWPFIVIFFFSIQSWQFFDTTWLFSQHCFHFQFQQSCYKEIVVYFVTYKMLMIWCFMSLSTLFK